MACACSCLRPAPASAGLKAASVTASLRYISCMASRLIGRGRHRGERRLRAGPATGVGLPASVGGALRSGALDRLQRTVAQGRLDRVASALGDVFPGIALIIGRGGSGAGRARTGGTIVVALERDAEALVLGRLRRFWRSRPRSRHHGERRGQSARERQPIKTENRLPGNIICPMDSIARLYDARKNRWPADLTRSIPGAAE